ncbi:MAG: glutathione S-transferase family protein [Paracoccaceae bacterium]
MAEQDGVRLIGFKHSVFSRAARIGCMELGVRYVWREHNPFDAPPAQHPFGRVPVLEQGGARIYETWAILIYLERFARQAPEESPLQAARVAQVAGMVSSYVYWPLVRQVYSQEVFAPAMGEAGDKAVVAEGYAAAPGILDALEALAAEGEVLTEATQGKADWILFPMIDAFCKSERAREMLIERPALFDWWQRFGAREGIAVTFTPLIAD